MFRANPGFQLALCLLMLFLFYILQIKHRPYMSTSERLKVIEEHRAKVALYDLLQAKGVKDKPKHAVVHKRIASHMKQALHAAADADKSQHSGKTQKWDHDDANDSDDDFEDDGDKKKKKGKRGAGTHKIKAEKVSDEPTHPVLSTVFSMVGTGVLMQGEGQ